MKITHKLLRLLTIFFVLGFALAACGSPEPTEETGDAVSEEREEEPAVEPESAPETETETEETTEEETTDSDEMESDMGDGILAQAMAGEFSGTVVTMFGPVTDEDEVRLNATIKPFEDATGIDIQYEGSKEFEATISVRVDAGDPPDIADFPQPGLLANFARDGKVVDLNQHLDRAYMEGQYIDSWLDMATMEGPDGPIMAGVWHRINGKSQVWYPKGAWDAAGYEVPTTWDELLELTQTISDDGDTPWCIGIESGVATGWAATDWTEEMMLRTTSLDNYDAWVRGELPFDSPEVRRAIDTWGEIWFNDEYVFGGRAAIATTFFGDAPLPMFEDPPKCWLHKQGSFITSFFPEGAEPGVDYDFFYLPSVDEEYGKPYLVAGDIYAAFSDRPEVVAAMEYFTRGESLKAWMEQGGALSPHKDVNLDWYGDPVERSVGAAIAEATSVRFDGSDLMPGEVGAGSFWTGMTDYVSDAADLDTVLPEIDRAWPAGIEGESGAVEAEEEEMAEEEMADSYLARAMAGEFSGTAVSVFGPFTDEDEVRFNATVAAFEDATGIDIQYEGSKEFEATISVRVDAGDPPDIADFPQPGLLANFARDGKVIDLNQFMDRAYLEGQYIDSWLDMATMEGPDGDIMAGIWHRINGKSQVWYPKAAWDAAGYEVPTTWDELLELTQTISDDGDTPWCIGIESGVATGWTATDWTEEMMLRTTSLDNYDAWVRGELPFDSPEVRRAIETWGEIWLNDEYVFGGQAAIATTFFGDAPLPMFEDPPKCWLHKQGSFITSFFPEGAEAGVDYDFFYLPSVDEEYGKPYLVAGDIYAAFSDRPEVMAAMEYFTRGESLKGWMELGGALSPHKDVNLDWYGDPVERSVGAAIAEATSVRFDGSDLMPGEVGAGSFWTGMTDYVSGAADLDTVLPEIDATWP